MGSLSLLSLSALSFLFSLLASFPGYFLGGLACDLGPTLFLDRRATWGRDRRSDRPLGGSRGCGVKASPRPAHGSSSTSPNRVLTGRSTCL
jgi:hypothetical protein